ncbi:NACHT, LRR and PYD domains-containing protein 1-like [Electrophorus electricus]|nr:NACHT, LRR and PYD domains-containing protein 1-like [Electrophorus electricus]
MELTVANFINKVQKKHEGSTYFETSSRCQLIPGRKYKASCDPYVPQPKHAEFDSHYGPNHHPTFVVFSEADVVTVSVLDEDGMEVWEPHQVFMISEKMEKCQIAEKTPLKMPAEVHFVDKYMDKLIGRVTSVMEIADCLQSKNMITDETYDKIHTEKTPQEQMRILNQALRSGGQNMKDEFYKILKEKQPFLIKDLESEPSKV